MVKTRGFKAKKGGKSGGAVQRRRNKAPAGETPLPPLPDTAPTMFIYEAARVPADFEVQEQITVRFPHTSF